MRLFVVELRRFWSRRTAILIAGVGLLFLLASLATLASSSQTPSPQEIETARADAQEERDWVTQERELCFKYWEKAPDTPPEQADYPKDCAGNHDPTRIKDTHYLSGVVIFADEAEGQLYFLGMVLAVCGLLIAGSYIGAEWTSGGMTNLLLWTPRRIPVYLAKLASALTSMFVLSVGLGVLHIGALLAIATSVGDVGQISSTWWSDTTMLSLRVLFLVMICTTVGVAMSMIGRRTVTAIGTFIGYLILVEFGVRFILAIVDIDIELWLMSTYIIGWTVGGTELWPVGAGYPDYLSMWTSGSILLAVTGVLTAIGMTLFQQRDAN
ncbi:ABC transporter permease subunit [Stackebrandtia soli]|uniref:ABC transporter permease subunit n=1 Tax=Stackebrandtia soli TaxID=1892856 RepID=UPI0039EC0CC3